MEGGERSEEKNMKSCILRMLWSRPVTIATVFSLQLRQINCVKFFVEQSKVTA